MSGRPKTMDGRAKHVPRTGRYPVVVFALTGLFLGLGLLKFGNPIIFDDRFPPPSSFPELIHFSWPAAWGWAGAALIGVLAFPLLRHPHRVPKWLLLAPVIWLGWQWIAALDSINPHLSRLTAIHFTVATGFFYLGLLATNGVANTLPVWLGLGIGLCLVVSTGFQQRFGGLAANREYAEKFLKGELPPDEQARAEAQGYRQMLNSPLGQHKLNSDRVFATLFYPNALAGVIILLTPGLLAAAWSAFKDASAPARGILIGLLGLGALACVIFSGSKGGQLIVLTQALLLLWSSLGRAIPPAAKKLAILAVAVAGTAAVVLLNLQYFQQGARSVGARTGYWVSAGLAFRENPWTGLGPGTFGEDYRLRKDPESEMAWLAHNDYLQQACDSGVVGFVGFAAIVLGGIGWSAFRLRLPNRSQAGLIGLGLMGWSMQSFSEFGLYIPAIAWPAFFLLGTLSQEAAIQIDSNPHGTYARAQ